MITISAPGTALSAARTFEVVITGSEPGGAAERHRPVAR